MVFLFSHDGSSDDSDNVEVPSDPKLFLVQNDLWVMIKATILCRQNVSFGPGESVTITIVDSLISKDAITP